MSDAEQQIVETLKSIETLLSELVSEQRKTNDHLRHLRRENRSLG